MLVTCHMYMHTHSTINNRKRCKMNGASALRKSPMYEASTTPALSWEETQQFTTSRGFWFICFIVLSVYYPERFIASVLGSARPKVGRRGPERQKACFVFSKHASVHSAGTAAAAAAAANCSCLRTHMYE